jgi:hypothetical protein
MKRAARAMKSRPAHTHRNPEAEAAAMSEVFHGRPAQEVTEYSELLEEHAWLAEFGRLEALYIALDGNPFFLGSRLDRATGQPQKAWLKTQCAKIRFDGCALASNEKGTQLFFVGGDQSLDVREFGQDPTKESVILGPVAFIEYSTAKYHLGKEDEIAGPYIHPFSEETKGALPVCCYDTVNQLQSLVGGSYHVDRDMGGGKYSSGIRD